MTKFLIKWNIPRDTCIFSVLLSICYLHDLLLISSRVRWQTTVWLLQLFQNDKAPGEDGFTIEFYTSFFELLGNDLIASFNEAYEKGEHSISQRRGLITLIPKEDGSLLDLSNWRPITLLNVDLKIASKAIAKRIEPTLPNLIHSDQTGFVKGRYIGENIRLISDIMDYTSLQNLPGILTSLDFRKAFAPQFGQKPIEDSKPLPQFRENMLDRSEMASICDQNWFLITNWKSAANKALTF